MEKTRIAIEATGTDGGFEPVLEGARLALERNEIILVVGIDKLKKLKEEYAELGGVDRLIEDYAIPDGIEVILTEHTYKSDEPSKIRRQKREKTSIYRAIEMHKNKEVDAVIAPGDTIGSVTIAKKNLGLINKVDRPALPTHWPMNNVLIDSGARPTCTPRNLYQFAIMGRVFSQNYLGVAEPFVGLLGMGHETSKAGRKEIMDAKILMDRLLGHGYHTNNGFFEPDFLGEIYGGQVIAVDGFMGNVMLKTAEAAIGTLFGSIYEEILKEPYWRQVCAKIGMERAKERLKEKFNWKKYSTSPLLGVDGNVMVCHGRSDAEAITNAIEITNRYLKCNINQHLAEEMHAYG